MNRRHLLKQLAATSALCGISTLGLSSRAHALVSNHNWVFITASGGWDTTNQWDPKGKEVVSKGGPINTYASADIRTIGNLRYAPVPEAVETSDLLHSFTQKHYQKMMLIHGIDQGTNSHSTGQRIAMVGADGRGTPTMGALFAAPYAASQSMPFIVAGGYSHTAGLLPESKLLSRYNYTRLNDPDNYLDTDAAFELLNQQKAQQIDTLLASSATQAHLRALNKLATARNGSGGIAELIERIPGELSRDSQYAAAEMAAAGFASGAATSVSLRVGGFDSHDDNDLDQWKSMDKLLALLEHVINHLNIQGVADKTTIVVGSDFGRRPFYNDDNGKDHWPITSMLLMGAGIVGNRVIGGTDTELKSRYYNPITLAEDENGIRLNPRSVFSSLRRLAGIEGSALDLRYPLNAEYMAIFD